MYVHLKLASCLCLPMKCTKSWVAAWSILTNWLGCQLLINVIDNLSDTKLWFDFVISIIHPWLTFDWLQRKQKGMKKWFWSIIVSPSPRFVSFCIQHAQWQQTGDLWIIRWAIFSFSCLKKRDIKHNDALGKWLSEHLAPEVANCYCMLFTQTGQKSKFGKVKVKKCYSADLPSNPYSLKLWQMPGRITDL